jgi:hypothetical protein
MFLLSIRGILALTATALVVFALGVSPAAPAVGQQATNLACNDGTNLNLALDPASVLQLSDAVSAINLHPAGDPALACGLSQPTPPPPGSGSQDHAVGGGNIVFPCPPFIARESFSLSAHVPSGTPVTSGTPQPKAGGTFNLSSPQSTATACGSEPGHLVAKIDCLQVSPDSPPGSATATAKITKSTGVFAPSPVGSELSIHVTDSGTNTGDTLEATGTFGPCDLLPVVGDPIDRGNINIRSGA